MSISRRQFLTSLGVSAGVVITGCAATQSRPSGRPGPLWPASADRPGPTAGGYAVPTPQPRTTPPSMTPHAGPVNAIARSQWAQAQPITSRLNTMAPPDRITLHHEGWRPVFFTDAQETADRLELIRRSHLDRMGAGDIGYHYIIDRAGRVWEGRPLAYQGAHVRNANPGNIGIMLLGNFDEQSPTDAQLTAMRSTVLGVRNRYRIAINQVVTHQELSPTACPGTRLQPSIVSLRSRSML